MKKMSGEHFFDSDGTTAIETFGAIVPSFFLTLIASVTVPVSSKNGRTVLRQFLLEFVLVVVPVLLIITILAKHYKTVLCLLSVATALSCRFAFVRNARRENANAPKIAFDQIGFLTTGRAMINLISVAAILAVDFTIFPRPFAKTRTFGYSLMDVGVGLFIFSNGIVVPYAHRQSGGLLSMPRSVVPLLALGLARFLLTKETDYYVPVAEYGVHWNFFITLAITKLVSTIVLTFVPVQKSLLVGIGALLIHEISLQLGLARYVLSDAPRSDGFLAANREGAVSSLGYVSMHFLSVAFGQFLRDSKDRDRRSLLKLAAMSTFLLYASLILEKNFGVSRRLANSGYCLWIMFIGVCMMSLFYFAQLARKLLQNDAEPPMLLQAINYNGLFFFLFANILTGVINLSWNTIQIEAAFSLIILTSYMFLNTAAVTILYCKKIKIK